MLAEEFGGQDDQDQHRRDDAHEQKTGPPHGSENQQAGDGDGAHGVLRVQGQGREFTVKAGPGSSAFLRCEFLVAPSLASQLPQVQR